MPITTANAVVAQAVSWLWPERLPLGKLLILDGDPDPPAATPSRSDTVSS
jgi:hypothetical protein